MIVHIFLFRRPVFPCEMRKANLFLNCSSHGIFHVVPGTGSISPIIDIESSSRGAQVLRCLILRAFIHGFQSYISHSLGMMMILFPTTSATPISRNSHVPAAIMHTSFYWNQAALSGLCVSDRCNALSTWCPFHAAFRSKAAISHRVGSREWFPSCWIYDRAK